MGEDRRRKKLQKEQYAYMDLLKNYKEQGVPIFIDGRAACKEQDWYKIFQVREHGAVYMADYVDSDKGRLAEIHFDLVYLDLDARQAWENQERLKENVQRAQLRHYRSLLHRLGKEAGQRKRGGEGSRPEGRGRPGQSPQGPAASQ